MSNYDIFISYRRKDTGDKAEHLKDLLEKKYKNRISFDRENLTGLFDVALARRIDSCKDFLLVIGKNTFNFTESDYESGQVELYKYLGSCSNKEFDKKIEELGPNAPIDFVRIEIARALHRKDLNIIPIVPEKTESFNFSDLDLPSDIAGIKRYGAVFYSDHPDRLFKDIMPNLYPKLVSKPKLQLKWILLPLVLLTAIGACALAWHQHVRKDVLRTELQKKHDSFQLYFNKGLSVGQMNAIDDILDKMVPIKPDALWMSQFEFTIGQWNGVLGEPYNANEKDIPLTGKSYGEIQMFIIDLSDMTNINFDIPSAEEWLYAAHNGSLYDSTLYVGSNDVDSVAWYKGNSNGMIHPSNGQQGKGPNKLDLFDMSGNVGEICNTPYVSGTDNAPYTVCGGNYTSTAEEVTATSLQGIDPNAHDKTTGFRLIIRKQD